MRSKHETILSKKYRKNIFITACAVLIIGMAISIYQYYVQRSEHIDQVLELVKERNYEIDAILKSTTDRITELYIFTENKFRNIKSLPLSPLYSFIGNSPKGPPHYSLEHSGTKLDLYSIGNMIGLGSFNGRQHYIYEEINIALWLLELEKAIKETTAHIAYIYYLSVNKIFSGFPPSLEEEVNKKSAGGFYEFIQALQVTPWWDPIIPKNNPEGHPRWTKAYLDPTSLEMMVSYAIPININNKLRAMVAADITLEFLSKALHESKHPNGFFLIIDKELQVLASSGKDIISKMDTKLLTPEQRKAAYAKKSIPLIYDYLPERLKHAESELFTDYSLKGKYFDGYNIFVQQLSQAPWDIIYVFPETDLIREILFSFTINFVVVAILFAMLAFSYRLLEKTFVTPAIALVEHISREARGLPGKAPSTNHMWFRWFEQVSNVFKETRVLHEELEARVEKRTVELKLAKSEAEAARINAEEANTAKSRFLANMSHELRTPLNSILGFTQLLKRKYEFTTEQIEGLNIIEQSGIHLLSLINDVLDMSKIEVGKAIYKPGTFDLYNTIKSIEKMVRVEAEKKGLVLSVELPENLPAYVMADERKLRQVLINLLNNAVKFTNHGSVTLRLKIPQEEICKKFPEQLIVEIEDTGVGIAASDIEDIFNPFVQSKKDEDVKEGTGLGLSISRQFIKLMRGDITVKSREGQGSIFKFNFKIASPDLKQIKKEQNLRVVGIVGGGSGYRILIVDDNKANRILLRQVLQLVGFSLKEAKNGEEAVKYYNEWHPHLIWLDMRMPILDGFETVRQIKNSNKGKETVVIALTASAYEEDRDRMLDAGCDDFVRKPFVEKEIFTVMEKHLGIKYIYEERQQENDGEIIRDLPSSEDFSALPPQWVSNLKEAVVALDVEKSREIVELINGKNEILAKGLLVLVNHFRFDLLKDIIDKNEYI